jgi:hypothetical protein
MGRQLQELTFSQWLRFVFDHPTAEFGLEWYWDLEADWWAGSSLVTLQYLTQAFENASVALQPYSDTQLDRGLWYLASNACSDHMFALLDTSVPWPARQRCVRSFVALYEQCFAPRCSPHLGHLSEPGANPLNMVCYMWWDIIPLIGQPDVPDRKELDREILEVLESILAIHSLACRESALHGLGHWQLYYPGRVKCIIDRFLNEQAVLRPELRSYALDAAHGCVL